MFNRIYSLKFQKIQNSQFQLEQFKISLKRAFTDNFRKKAHFLSKFRINIAEFRVKIINFSMKITKIFTSSDQLRPKIFIFFLQNFPFFIKNFRCPSLEAMEEMEIKLYSNGDSSVSTFSTSLFQFGDYELSYLHAQVKVCFLEHETCPTKVKIVNFNLKMIDFD